MRDEEMPKDCDLVYLSDGETWDVAVGCRVVFCGESRGEVCVVSVEDLIRCWAERVRR